MISTRPPSTRLAIEWRTAFSTSVCNANVGVRPEAWRLVSAEQRGLPVDVTVVEELGADGFAYGTSDVDGTPTDVIVRISSARDSVHKGDTIHVTTDPKNVHVFDTDSGERLSQVGH